MSDLISSRKRVASPARGGGDSSPDQPISKRQNKKYAKESAEVIDLTSIPLEKPTTGTTTTASALDAPFHLLHVRGIPEWANQGILGYKFSEAIKGPIQWALVSNYMMDFSFLVSMCPDLRSAPRVVVVHGEKGAKAASIHHDINAAGMSGRAFTHAPPLPAYGTHHSKAFLVRFPRGLRVIVHTANLLYCDCYNKSQAVYSQDFPLKDSVSPPTSIFEASLLNYLGALKQPPSLWREAADIVRLHDFSAARVHLIASVPSAPFQFGGPEKNAWGHLKLRACLEQETFPLNFKSTPVVSQYSSIGNITPKWLGQFVESLSAGKAAGIGKLGPPAGWGGGSNSGGSNSDTAGQGLHLVWPTISEVQNSLEGWFAGQSIPGYHDKVTKDFLKPYYRRWGGEVNGRQRSMPHQKSFLRFDHGSGEIAWTCFTSHNLSKAAWGEEVESKKYGKSLLRVLSYELGALSVPSLELAYRRSRWCGFSCTDNAAVPGPMDGIDDTTRIRFIPWKRDQPQKATLAEGVLTVPLPIAYRLPPQTYNFGEDIPWDVRDNMPGWPGIDALGARFPGVGRHYGLLDRGEADWGEVMRG